MRCARGPSPQTDPDPDPLRLPLPQVVSMAEAGGAEADKMLKQRRKLALVRLELVKPTEP